MEEPIAVITPIELYSGFLNTVNIAPVTIINVHNTNDLLYIFPSIILHPKNINLID